MVALPIEIAGRDVLPARRCPINKMAGDINNLRKHTPSVIASLALTERMSFIIQYNAALN